MAKYLDTVRQWAYSASKLACAIFMQMPSFLRNSPTMAYLAMMSPRLVELHRVLKITGRLYLHHDLLKN